MLKLPGLIDPHVHFREPGATHKEDWDTGTAAALAGGFTAVLAMPNTQPPVSDAAVFEMVEALAAAKARCDFACYIGAGVGNALQIPALAARAAGLKMYLDQTYGELRLDSLTNWMAHFANWPADRPIVAHAEGRSMAAVMLLAALYHRPVHIAHVSRREEVLLIREAKERGLKVTCEVSPHHLFLTAEDIPSLGPGRSEVRPRLGTSGDCDALWANLDVIDCFATDHAPHTVAEKDGPDPPPGFPGLETALPLLLTAVYDGRLTLDDLVAKMVDNPRRIFGLPEQPETWIEVDQDAGYELRAAEMFSRCGWTPFEGWKVRGRLRRVVLRGREAFRDGKVLALPGFGRTLRIKEGECSNGSLCSSDAGG